MAASPQPTFRQLSPRVVTSPSTRPSSPRSVAQGIAGRSIRQSRVGPSRAPAAASSSQEAGPTGRAGVRPLGKVLALDLGTAAAGVVEHDPLRQAARRVAALQLGEELPQALVAARRRLVDRHLQVERHTEPAVQPQRVALDARTETLAGMFAIRPGGHVGTAGRGQDPLALGTVLAGVDVPAVDDALRLLRLVRVARCPSRSGSPCPTPRTRRRSSTRPTGTCSIPTTFRHEVASLEDTP